ncbi:uncharacterized protein CBL_00012 [Carabus blaptoides fortunei]
MNSNVLVACILALIACQVLGQDQYYGHNEPGCVQQGGRCIQSSECEEFAPGEGLCPDQKSQGFECCYGIPKSEHRCRHRGGECFKKNYCAPALLYREASDCGVDQECCILV